MKFSESTKNIFNALADFHSDIKQPKKDANNPFFKSKYVPLENVVDVIDKVAPQHGLSYTQNTVSDENNRAGAQTVLTHKSGEYILFDPLYLKPDKQTPQGMGSAITYARRYSLSSAFGIASETDDDGNEASGHNNKKKQNTNKKSPQKPTEPPQDDESVNKRVNDGIQALKQFEQGSSDKDIITTINAKYNIVFDELAGHEKLGYLAGLYRAMDLENKNKPQESRNNGGIDWSAVNG